MEVRKLQKNLERNESPEKVLSQAVYGMLQQWSQLSPPLSPWFSETAALQMCSILLWESLVGAYDKGNGYYSWSLALLSWPLWYILPITWHWRSCNTAETPLPAICLQIRILCCLMAVVWWEKHLGLQLWDGHIRDRYNLVFEDSIIWALCRALDADTSKGLLKTIGVLEESLEELLQYKTRILVRDHLNSLHWRGWTMVV